MEEYKQEGETSWGGLKFFRHFMKKRWHMDPDTLADIESDDSDDSEEEKEKKPSALPYCAKPLAIEVISDEMFEKYCHFNRTQFDYIWSKVEPCFPSRQEQHLFIDPKNQFFLLLYYCSTYQTFNEIAKTAEVESNYLGSIIRTAAKKVYKRLQREFIKNQPSVRLFENFPEAIGACDTALIPTYGIYSYSQKDKQNGTKVQAIVNPDGICINAKFGYSGELDGVTIFRASKTLNELGHETVIDNQKHFSYYPVLFDSDYIQLKEDNYPESIIKKPIPEGQNIDPIVEAENQRIEHDRVIVKHFFERMKTLWRVTDTQFRGDQRNQYILTIICVSLTNYYNRFHPLI